MLPQTQKPSVTVIHRTPFSLGVPDVWQWPAGQTIAEIVRRVPLAERDEFERRGVVVLNGHEIHKGLWHVVKPRADRGAIVTLHMPVRGASGSQGGGARKQAVAIVAAIAIAVASAGLASGAGATLLGLGAGFASGTLGATLLATAVAFAGSILVASLTSSPTRQSDSSDVAAGADASSLEPSSVQGNVLQPNTPIPRVIGTRRIFPPLAAEPTLEYVGQDEIAHALFVLAGPHAIANPKFGETAYDPSTTDGDIVLQTYDGLSGSTVPDYPQRYSRTFPVNVDLSKHGNDPQNLAQYAPPLPLWHGTNTAEAPNEVWLHFLLAGLIRSQAPTELLRVPIRIRLRRRGDPDWRYLPELHYMDATQSQRRFQVKLKFGESFAGPFPQPSATRGFVEARKSVPAQNVAPTGAVWDADAYFSAGAGNDVYSSTTYTTTRVKNVDLQADVATIYLAEADWTPGIYDIEVKRGSAFRNADFTSSTYTLSGSVLDFFGMRETQILPLTYDGLYDQINFVRAVSVRNSAPLQQTHLSIMYVQAINRQAGNFSVEASGYVRDYSAGAWTNLITTSNPAPHFRDMLVGTLNFNAMPTTMLDDASLIEWRDVCDSEGYRCDLVVEGNALYETMRIVASCGYARPYASELWGVIRDYDRSAEAPVQIFSPRNSRGFAWQKAFARVPDGLRVNYRDETAEYAGRQLVVYRNGVSQLDARTEQITYDGLIDRDQIIQRANFDLAQAIYRTAIYTLEAPVESIVCRRGSLVGVNHDILMRHTGWARILDVNRDASGYVVSILLDTQIDVYNNADMLAQTDMLAVTDMSVVGLKTAIAIRRTNGNNSIHVVTASASQSDLVTLAAPLNDSGDTVEGCLVVAGISGNEYKRLIVSEIAPGANLTASLTLVDEAPELWAA